jgi:hypothetical protein
VPTSFALPQINSDERMLWIHAGPHKAASSYVTERLRKNRSTLAAQRVLMDGDNNLLANSIAEKIISLWNRPFQDCRVIFNVF